MFAGFHLDGSWNYHVNPLKEGASWATMTQNQAVKLTLVGIDIEVKLLSAQGTLASKLLVSSGGHAVIVQWHCAPSP